MRPIPVPTPAGTAADDIERELAEAQRDKALSQVPAIRRLKYVTRAFFVLGVAGLALALPSLSVSIRSFGKLVASPVDVVAFVGFLLFVYVSQTLSLLLLVAYWRFGKQLRLNQIRQVADTASVIGRVWQWSVGLGLAQSLLMAFLQRRQPIYPVGALVGGYIFTLLMFAVMRHYVRTAMAELPELISRAGLDIPAGTYRSWKQLSLIAIGIFAPFVAYALIGLVKLGALVS